MLHGWDGIVACLIMGRWTLPTSSCWRIQQRSKIFFCSAAIDITVTIMVADSKWLHRPGSDCRLQCPAESWDWQLCCNYRIWQSIWSRVPTAVHCFHHTPLTDRERNICIINHVCVAVHTELTRFPLLTIIAIFWLEVPQQHYKRLFVIYFHIFITNIFTTAKSGHENVLLSFREYNRDCKLFEWIHSIELSCVCVQ